VLYSPHFPPEQRAHFEAKGYVVRDLADYARQLGSGSWGRSDQ
jgi:hypothetical protein